MEDKLINLSKTLSTHGHKSAAFYVMTTLMRSGSDRVRSQSSGRGEFCKWATGLSDEDAYKFYWPDAVPSVMQDLQRYVMENCIQSSMALYKGNKYREYDCHAKPSSRYCKDLQTYIDGPYKKHLNQKVCSGITFDHMTAYVNSLVTSNRLGKKAIEGLDSHSQKDKFKESMGLAVKGTLCGTISISGAPSFADAIEASIIPLSTSGTIKIGEDELWTKIAEYLEGHRSSHSGEVFVPEAVFSGTDLDTINKVIGYNISSFIKL
jgi:hypothetical protein